MVVTENSYCRNTSLCRNKYFGWDVDVSRFMSRYSKQHVLWRRLKTTYKSECQLDRPLRDAFCTLSTPLVVSAKTKWSTFLAKNTNEAIPTYYETCSGRAYDWRKPESVRCSLKRKMWRWDGFNWGIGFSPSGSCSQDCSQEVDDWEGDWTVRSP